MKICIVGVGGVGGYFGARLAVAGHEVSLIARGATLQALRSRGLSIESPLGDLHLRDVTATDDPSEIGEVDVVILGVKTWQVPTVAEAARPLVGDNTVVLPLQNGIETTDQLAAVFGPRPVLGGTCRISAAIVEPGRIRHMGVAPWIALGELDGRSSRRVRRLAAALEGAGIAVEVSRDIQAEIWRKFLLIASTSGVGAVARRPLADLRANPETLDLMRRAMEEVAALAAARGVTLTADTV
jgi:2-dehydropantoate 2-reductase